VVSARASRARESERIGQRVCPSSPIPSSVTSKSGSFATLRFDVSDRFQRGRHGRRLAVSRKRQTPFERGSSNR
jgi:hypothetical protein